MGQVAYRAASTVIVATKLTKYDRQNIANTAWSISQHHFIHIPVMQCGKDASMQAVPQFDPVHLTNTAWSFAL